MKIGHKNIEFRDAHITFIDESTGEKLRRNVIDVGLMDKDKTPTSIRNLFEDKKVIFFKLE